MENFFVCRKDGQIIDMELVHSFEDLNRLTSDIQTSHRFVVQQRLNETWDSFISRAQKNCQTILPPHKIEFYLDARRFCSLEYNLEGPFHFKAIPCSDGEIRLTWNSYHEKNEYYQVNVFIVQTLLFPQMELYIPIGKEIWNQIRGTWQMRIDSRNRLYWDCKSGVVLNSSQSRAIRVVARPGEQFQNQNSPQPICDASDTPFEFVQSRRLAHSDQ